MRILGTCLLTASLFGGPALAADVAAGKKLHEAHCVACHVQLTGGNPDALYTRADRKVTTRAGLDRQVRRCELSLGLSWFDEDVANVAEYLNQRFYKLAP